MITVVLTMVVWLVTSAAFAGVLATMVRRADTALEVPARARAGLPHGGPTGDREELRRGQGGPVLART